MLIGTFAVAVVQGTILGLSFWVLGLPSPAFWGVVTLATLVALAIGIRTLDTSDLLWPIVASVALIAVGAFMDARASELTRPANLYLSQALIAFAAMFFIGPTMMAGVLRALPKGPSHMVSYSAVFGIAQNLGGLGGGALLGTFQIVREKFHSHELVQSIVATDPLVAARLQALAGAYARSTLDPVARQVQGSALLSQQVTRAANILAYNDVSLLIGTIACLTLAWLGSRWLYFRLRGVNPLQDDLDALQRLLANRR